MKIIGAVTLAFLALGCGGGQQPYYTPEKSAQLTYNLTQGTSTDPYSTLPVIATVKVGTSNQIMPNTIILRANSVDNTLPIAVLMEGSQIALPGSGTTATIDGVTVPIDSLGKITESVLLTPKTVGGEFTVVSKGIVLGRLALATSLTISVKAGPKISTLVSTIHAPDTGSNTRSWTLAATTSGTSWTGTMSASGTFPDSTSLLTTGTLVTGNPISLPVTLNTPTTDVVAYGDKATLNLVAN